MIMKTNKVILVAILILGTFSCSSNSQEELKWNFKKFKKLTYNYTQIMESESPFGLDKKVYNEAKGTLIVSIKENGKADLIFKELMQSVFLITEKGDTSRMVSQISPDFFIQDMDEYGKIDGPLNQKTELLAHILFPIPKSKISVNSVAKLPVIIPFNMFGSQINVKGFNTVKLESLEKSIASMSTVLVVSDYDIPKDANVNYECYMKGTSVYKFDLSKGYFINAELNITAAAKISSKENDKKSNNGDTIPENMSKTVGMSMKTNIKLDLKKAE